MLLVAVAKKAKNVALVVGTQQNLNKQDFLQISVVDSSLSMLLKACLVCYRIQYQGLLTEMEDSVQLTSLGH